MESEPETRSGLPVSTANESRTDDALPRHHHRRHRRVWRIGVYIVILLFGYLLLAYLAMPLFWLAYVDQHPLLDDMPRITHTADGIPGDPLNVALIGTEAEVEKILTAAGWFRADPLGLRSDLKIAEATILKRPYEAAPVSRLYLFGRREDLAYEKPVGNNPRQRHHVRWWRADSGGRKADEGGGRRAEGGEPAKTSGPQPSALSSQPSVWIGSATFDRDVGFSHTTGQITHHIATDIDAQRDELFEDLDKTGLLAETYFVDNFHKTRSGKNGGGDPWHTDGRLQAGVIEMSQ